MDKSYLNESLHKMADYLSTHGYQEPINLKTLSRPSTRDFKNIMGFLFRQIDPSYVPSARFEDDVLPFLKMIRYPYPLSRSSLQAVGAPQTWPKVMGAISWIVDTLMYEEETESAELEERTRRQEATQEERDQDEADGLTDQGVDHNKEYLDYLANAYAWFLEGEDDAYEKLTADFMAARDEDRIRSDDRCRELDEAKGRLLQQKSDLEEHSNSLPKLEERRRAALSDSEKYTTMLEKLKAHKQTLRDKIDTRLEEEKRLKDALVPVEDAKTVLRDQIAKQEFSAEDVERQIAERRRVKDAINAAQEAKATQRNKNWEMEEQLATCLKAATETMQSYNQKVKELQLLDKNADGVQYEAKLDESRLTEDEGILSVDVRGVIRPSLANLKGAIMRRTQDLRQELQNLLVVEDKVEEEIADIEDQLERVLNQVRYKEDLYNKAKYKLDQTVAEEKRKLEEEDRRLASLDSPEDVDRMAAEHDAAIDELRVQNETLKERQVMELKQLESTVHGALEMALDYMEMEEKVLAGLKERCTLHLQEISNNETVFDAMLVEIGEGVSAILEQDDV